MATPDRMVRAQIEAIKDHLTAEGLTEIQELLTKASEGFHTLRAEYGGTTRLLRLSYVWLSDDPEDAARWVQDKGIAQSLKADDFDITIRDSGLTQGKL